MLIMNPYVLPATECFYKMMEKKIIFKRTETGTASPFQDPDRPFMN